MFHRPGNLVRVFAHEQETQAHHDFALAIGGDRAATDLRADNDLADVTDADRHAAGGLNHNALDLVDVRRATKALNEHRLCTLADRPCADVAVVLLCRPNHVVEG